MLVASLFRHSSVLLLTVPVSLLYSLTLFDAVLSDLLLTVPVSLLAAGLFRHSPSCLVAYCDVSLLVASLFRHSHLSLLTVR